MRFSRQEYWSELPHPPPGDLSDPGIEPVSLRSPALGGGFFTTSATLEALMGHMEINFINLSLNNFNNLNQTKLCHLTYHYSLYLFSPFLDLWSQLKVILPPPSPSGQLGKTGDR